MAADESHDDKTQSFIALTSGTSVLHYDILEKIGSGGMGEVYLALDTKLNRKVALKFLPPHLCQDEDCRKRFTREAQAAAGLDHPNIAAIYEVGEFQGRPFYAMQVVEGQSLKDVIAGKDLPIDRILEIGVQVCEGLQAAHDNGIIHRDIKPSNILLDSHGRVRIVDFGLAAIRGSEQLTKTGSTLGTIGYMSPEQVQGKEIDQRSDLFSLGVVLYELITKQNPFKRDSEAATLKAVSDDLPEPLARFKSALPEGLQAIVEKALEKDTKTRYQHADGMLSDLMRVKRSIESGQSTISVSPRSKHPRRTWWVAAVVVVVAAVILVLTQPWQTDTALQEPEKMMLAVMPFENLGDPEDEYFADGITDEVISRLASVRDVGVISRTSVYAYKNSPKPLPEIADELGVDYILEGTIRWDRSNDASRIRVTPQLIEVASDVHLWSDRYDRSLTNVFDVQSDIATKVVEALGTSLQSTNSHLLTRVPTENMEAYNAFLRAKELYYMPDVDRAKAFQMIGLLERAVQLDSSFASAHAMLSMAHGRFWHIGLDHTTERLNQALHSAQAALECDPSLPDGHMAMAWYHYRSQRNYEAAFDELEAAETAGATRYDLDRLAATLYKRQGHFENAIEHNERALKSNPRDPDVMQETAICYKWIGQTRRALDLCMKMIEVGPEQHSSYGYAAMFSRSVPGGLSQARTILKGIPGELTERDHAEWVYQEFCERDTSAMLRRLESLEWESLSDQNEIFPKALWRAWMYRYLGNPRSAPPLFELAAEKLQTQRQQRPDDDRLFISLAYAYAGLNQPEDAMAYVDSALQCKPADRFLIGHTFLLNHKINICAGIGKLDESITLVDQMLQGPSPWTIHDYLNDPRIDPLRGHPRFQALIERYEKEHGT